MRKRGKEYQELTQSGVRASGALSVALDEFSKLRALRYRARAYWGTETSTPFDTFEKIIGQVLSAARLLPGHWQRHNQGGPFSGGREEFDERVRELEERIWGGEDEDSPLTQLAEDMVKQAEQLCQPVIEKGT